MTEEIKTVTTDETKKDADALTPAVKPDASGAFQEPEIAERIDTSHPAVDDNPRKGTKPDSNRIDFNDPTLSAAEAVARNLEEQGMMVDRPIASEDDHKA